MSPLASPRNRTLTYPQSPISVIRRNTLNLEEARPKDPAERRQPKRNRYRVTIYRLLWVALGLFFAVSKFVLAFKNQTASGIMDLIGGITGVGLFCVDMFHEDIPEAWDWFFEADRCREIYLGAVMLKTILDLSLGFLMVGGLLIFCWAFTAFFIDGALRERFPLLPEGILITLSLLLSLLALCVTYCVILTSSIFLSLLRHRGGFRQRLKFRSLPILIAAEFASLFCILVYSIREDLMDLFWVVIFSPVFMIFMILLALIGFVTRIVTIRQTGMSFLDALVAEAKTQVDARPPLPVEPVPLHDLRVAIDILRSSEESLTEDCLRAWTWHLTSQQNPEDLWTRCIAPASLFRQLREQNSEGEKLWGKDSNWTSTQRCIIPIQHDIPKHWAVVSVNFRDKYIDYYSSLSNGTSPQQAEALELLTEFVKSRISWFSYRGWANDFVCPTASRASRVSDALTDRGPQDVPQQTDVFDSGVFCCAVIERLLKGQSPTKDDGFDFTTTDALAYRERMIRELEALIPSDQRTSAASPPDDDLADSAIQSSPVQLSESVADGDLGSWHPLE